MTRFAAAFLSMALPGPAVAACEGGTTLLACDIEGRSSRLTVCVEGKDAVYRFGPVDAQPELTLASPLLDLDYRRARGPRTTIDETVLFPNGAYSYRVAMGFDTDLETDPTALIEYARLTVSQDGDEIAEMACAPATIERGYDILIPEMIALGRERSSDGDKFPNYPVGPVPSASEAPACDEKSNVDTCWSRGVTTARGGDLAGALAHYDMSCDAGLRTVGCYEAGKLYLQNRQLRDYDRAYDRFSQACRSDDVGLGPHACKYLGWMHHTGIGAARDPVQAFDLLTQACFLHNTIPLVDAEGCHFLAQNISEWRDATGRDASRRDHMVYLAMSMGCVARAETICDDGQAFLVEGQARDAEWLQACESTMTRRFGPGAACADLTRTENFAERGQIVTGRLSKELRRYVLGEFRQHLLDIEVHAR